MDLVSIAEVERTQELVNALNSHLTSLIAKYPLVEVRTGHGYSIGESARVTVEFVHGRITVE
jgi:hypothetical protein